MASIQEITSDPEFFNLSEEAKRKVLTHFDPEFGTLSNEAQAKVITHFTAEKPKGFFEKLPGRAKGVATAIEEAIPEVVGGLGGAALTAGRRIPGVALGVGAGSALGEMGLQVEQALGLAPGQPPLTFTESLERQAGAFGRGVVGEGAVGLLGKLGKRAMAPFGKEVTKEAQRAKPVFEKLGVTPSPEKLKESQALDVMANISRSSLFGGGAFKEAEQEVVDKVASHALETFKKMGTAQTDEALGDIIQGAIGKKSETFRATGRGLYEAVDQKAKGVAVDITPVKEFAKELEKELSAGLTKSPTLKGILNTLKKKPELVTFKEAQLMRSNLLEVTQSITEAVPKRAEGASKKLASLIDGSIESSTKTLNPEAFEAWRAANEFWKGGKETFNSKFIKRLANAEPDKVLDQILKKERTFPLSTLKKTIGADSPEFVKIQEAFISRIQQKATNAEGQLIGKDAIKFIRSHGADFRKELFTKGELDSLETSLHALELAQKATVSDIGSVAIQLAQTGALLNVAAAPAKMVAFLASPLAMFKLMTKPGFQKWFTKGLELPVGTPSQEVFSVLARMKLAAEKEGVEVQITDNPNANPARTPTVLDNMPRSSPRITVR